MQERMHTCKQFGPPPVYATVQELTAQNVQGLAKQHPGHLDISAHINEMTLQGFTKSYPSWGLLICVITIMLMMLGDHFAQGYIESTTAAAVAEAQACMDL